ncbi:hypothetical protein MKW92_029839, partial [Papaver armeniacum]
PCLLEVNGYGPTKHVFTSVGGEGLADETLSEGYDYEMDVAVACEKVLLSICVASMGDEWTGGTSVKVFLVKGDGGIELYTQAKIGSLKEKYFPNRFQ